MRRILLVFNILMATSVVHAGETHGWVEYLGRAGTIKRKDLVLFFNGPLSGKTGWFILGQNGKPDYSMIYGGPTYQLNNHLQIGLGAGFESPNHAFHFGTFGVWYDKHHTLLYVFEDGAADGTDRWHRLQFNRSLDRHWGIGFMDQALLGRGPRAELNAGKTKVWVASLKNRGAQTNLIGLRTNF